MKGFLQAEPEMLLEVPGVSHITQQKWTAWLATPGNADMLRELARLWQVDDRNSLPGKQGDFQIQVSQSSAPVRIGSVQLQGGDRIVVTGGFDAVSRDQIKDWCAVSFVDASYTGNTVARGIRAFHSSCQMPHVPAKLSEFG